MRDSATFPHLSLQPELTLGAGAASPALHAFLYCFLSHSPGLQFLNHKQFVQNTEIFPGRRLALRALWLRSGNM